MPTLVMDTIQWIERLEIHASICQLQLHTEGREDAERIKKKQRYGDTD